MKKILALALVSAAVLSACGTKTIIKEVAATTTAAPYVAPVTNKYDDYYAHVLQNSGQANSEPKSDVIEFGDLVCQALDSGRSVQYVVTLLNGYADSISDQELYAAIITGAILYLCSEYNGQLQNYLDA